jgi:hypothetical protein
VQLVAKYKKEKKTLPELPVQPKQADHKEKLQQYVTKLLEDKTLRNDEDVKKAFRLNLFYDLAKKEEGEYEGYIVPN